MENDSSNDSNQANGIDNERSLDSSHIYKCKGCNVSFKSLLKHLGQKEVCYQAYSDEEINDLKDYLKLVHNAKVSKRQKKNYKQDRPEILEKKSDYYQKNRSKIREQQAEYYLRKQKETQQRQHDQYVQEQRDIAAHAAESLEGGNNDEFSEVKKLKDKTEADEGDDNDSDYDETNDFTETKALIATLTPDHHEELEWLKSRLIKVEKLLQEDVEIVAKWYDALYDDIEKVGSFMMMMTAIDVNYREEVTNEAKSLLWKFKKILKEPNEENTKEITSDCKRLQHLLKHYKCKECGVNYGESWKQFATHLKTYHGKNPIKPYATPADRNKFKDTTWKELETPLLIKMREALGLMPPTEETIWKSEEEIAHLNLNTEPSLYYWGIPVDWSKEVVNAKIHLLTNIIDGGMDLDEDSWKWFKKYVSTWKKHGGIQVEFILLPFLRYEWLPIFNPGGRGGKKYTLSKKVSFESGPMMNFLKFLKFIPPDDDYLHWRFPHGVTARELGAKERFIEEIISGVLNFDQLQDVNFSLVGDIKKRKKLINIHRCKQCNRWLSSLLKHLGQTEYCLKSYSELEMKDLKDAVKLAHNAKESERKKINYENNKKDILERQKQYKQENKMAIAKQKAEYYEKNYGKILEKRAEYYLKNKEAVLEKTKQRQNEQKVQRQKEKSEASAARFRFNLERAEKRNQNIARAKKPINFTMEDLENDKEVDGDEEFRVKCEKPSTKKLQPKRKCSQ